MVQAFVSYTPIHIYTMSAPSLLAKMEVREANCVVSEVETERSEFELGYW